MKLKTVSPASTSPRPRTRPKPTLHPLLLHPCLRLVASIEWRNPLSAIPWAAQPAADEQSLRVAVAISLLRSKLLQDRVLPPETHSPLQIDQVRCKHLFQHDLLRRRLLRLIVEKPPLTRSADMASRILDGAVRLPRYLTGEVIATTDVNEAVQLAKGDRDLLRIFSRFELRKALRENGRSALVFSRLLSSFPP